MATASRELPFFVLIERIGSDRPHKFYSSYETNELAVADADALNQRREFVEGKDVQVFRYYVVTKAEGDVIVEDKAAPEPPASAPEERQSLDVVADKDGSLRLVLDKASIIQFVSPDDAEKIHALKAGESLTIETDKAAVSEITKGQK